MLVVALDAVTSGKTVGLYSKEPIRVATRATGASPDGMASTLPDHLYSIAALDEHRKMAESAVVEHRAIAAMIEEFDAQ